jgi:hypothetical protein
VREQTRKFNMQGRRGFKPLQRRRLSRMIGKVNADTWENPGSRLTDRQNGHLSDATSNLSCNFIESTTEISGLDAFRDCPAFVADDVREITPLERQQ